MADGAAAGLAVGARPPGSGPLSGEAWNAQQEAAFSWLCAVCARWLDRSPAAAEPQPPPATPKCGFAAVAWQAHAHALEPLLHHLLPEEPSPSGAPAHLRRRWAAAYERTRSHNARLFDAFEELSTEAAGAGLELIVVKGLATLAQHYGDPGLRSMRDLDVWCRERDAVALAALARRLGYRDGEQDTVYHLSFSHPERRVTLELHFDVYDVIGAGRDFTRRAWERRETSTLEGREVPVLSREQDLAFGLAHLVHHDFRLGLRSYLELAAAASSLSIDEGRALWDELESCDLSRELRLTLPLIEGLFGRSFAALAALQGPATELEARRARELAATVHARLPRINRHTATGTLVELAARPTARSKWVYLRRLLLPPADHLRTLGGRQSLLFAYARHWRQTLQRVASALRGRRSREDRDGLSIKGEVHARRH